MTLITLDDIREHGPCYDPARWAPEGWTGTVLDVLTDTRIPVQDRIWVGIKFLDARHQRMYSCWCVRYTPLADGRVVWDLLTDERSRAAVEVSERYAVGEATADELAAAWDAAWAAARTAARDTAWDAARDAARAAAWDAARAAARTAARTAAWAAARDTAWAAAWDAAWDAARDAARDAQLARLVEIYSHA